LKDEGGYGFHAKNGLFFIKIAINLFPYRLLDVRMKENGLTDG